jgi:hypothetical protein
MNGRSVEGTIRTKKDKGVYRQEFKGMRDQSKGIHCTFFAYSPKAGLRELPAVCVSVNLPLLTF